MRFIPPGPLSPLNLGPCLKAKYQLQCCRALQKMCIQAINLPQSFEMYGSSKESTFFLYQEPELIQVSVSSLLQGKFISRLLPYWARPNHRQGDIFGSSFWVLSVPPSDTQTPRYYSWDMPIWVTDLFRAWFCTFLLFFYSWRFLLLPLSRDKNLNACILHFIPHSEGYYNRIFHPLCCLSRDLKYFKVCFLILSIQSTWI